MRQLQTSDHDATQTISLGDVKINTRRSIEADARPTQTAIRTERLHNTLLTGRRKRHWTSKLDRSQTPLPKDAHNRLKPWGFASEDRSGRGGSGKEATKTDHVFRRLRPRNKPRRRHDGTMRAKNGPSAASCRRYACLQLPCPKDRADFKIGYLSSSTHLDTASETTRARVRVPGNHVPRRSH